MTSDNGWTPLADLVGCEAEEQWSVDLEPTCEHGCPDGMHGIHQAGCEWSGIWFHGDQQALVLGVSPDGETLCVSIAGETEDEHVHLPAASLRKLEMTR